MKRNAQNNPVTQGAIGTEQKTLKNLFKLKAMKIFRLLAFFALFGSVGYALANNQQSICQDSELESYKSNDGTLPTLPPSDPGANVTSIGHYFTNFTCSNNMEKTCHYVYDSDNNRWVECKGDYLPNP